MTGAGNQNNPEAHNVDEALPPIMAQRAAYGPHDCGSQEKEKGPPA